jgi:hypothetical protein
MRTPRSDACTCGPVVNMKTAEGVKKFEAIANDVADLVLEFGGALSGEHGDGLVRSPFMRKMFGPVLYEAFRTIKRTFDPDGIFNPGKIVDSPPLTDNLRFGAGYVSPNPPTFFDYSEFGGMGGAVEMCSGLGACRKKLEGTMCPSYMATKEEKDVTRGRANVLRLAMTGKLARPDSTITAFTRRSISAWNAAPARRSARWASIWRASRASSWPATGRLTDAAAREDAGQRHTIAKMGSPIAPLMNRWPASKPMRRSTRRYSASTVAARCLN